MLVHVLGGFTIFLVFSNISRIKIEIRGKVSLLIVLIAILLMELNLSLLQYQSISFDIVIDIILTVAGGLIGYFIFIHYNGRKKANELMT